MSLSLSLSLSLPLFLPFYLNLSLFLSFCSNTCFAMVDYRNTSPDLFLSGSVHECARERERERGGGGEREVEEGNRVKYEINKLRTDINQCLATLNLQKSGKQLLEYLFTEYLQVCNQKRICVYILIIKSDNITFTSRNCKLENTKYTYSNDTLFQ